MIELRKSSGLDIRVEGDMTVIFGEHVEVGSVSVRKGEELRDVLMDEKCKVPEIAYYMYRGVHRKGDEELHREHNIRYDITVITKDMLGEECMKTAGHYHPKFKKGLTYPEVYEVLYGKAHYLLQKPSNGYDTIDDFVIIEAKEGDKVLIPPNYGHVTVNPTDDILVMSNLVSSKFSSIYEPVKRMKGFCYYELNGNRFLKNERYRDVPDMRIVKVKRFPELGIGKKPLYISFYEEPNYFNFLNEPEVLEEIQVL